MAEFDYKLAAKSGKGNFDIVTPDEQVLTSFTYEDWFASKGVSEFNGNEYEFKPANIWWSKINVYRNGILTGDIVFNWKGNIIIQLKTQNGEEKKFALIAKGVWNFRFVLEDEHNQELLVMTTSFKWNKLHYEYLVNTSNGGSENTDFIELLLCCGYGANLYMTMMTVIAS